MRTDNNKSSALLFFQDHLVYVVLLVLVTVFSLLNKNFFQMENFIGIGRQTAIVSVIAFGMTFVITTGGIDLSVGSVLALSGLLAALTLKATGSVLLATLVGILAGGLQGFVNGFLVAKMKIPAFLATLGMMSIARGISLTITNTKTCVLMNQTASNLWGNGTAILGIPMSIVWTLLLFAGAIVLYHYTPFGNYVKAIGGNITSALYSGVSVNKILMITYTLTGLLCGVSGLLMTARLGGARPEIGAGMELDAVASVVLGGTAVSGGKGNVVNTLIGSLIMGVITNGLIILGIQSNIQQIFKGAIIILAVALGSRND